MESYFHSKKTLKAIKGPLDVSSVSLSSLTKCHFLYNISLFLFFSTIIHISQPLLSISQLGATWCLQRHICH